MMKKKATKRRRIPSLVGFDLAQLEDIIEKATAACKLIKDDDPLETEEAQADIEELRELRDKQNEEDKFTVTILREASVTVYVEYDRYADDGDADSLSVWAEVSHGETELSEEDVMAIPVAAKRLKGMKAAMRAYKTRLTEVAEKHGVFVEDLEDRVVR